MLIQIDSREKQNDLIIDGFVQNGIKWFVSKLYCGDYANFDSPRVVVERKKDIREIATNVTSKKQTFYKELDKLNELGLSMVILITQNTIDKKKITSLEDVMLWTPPKGHGTVSGMRIYKELAIIEKRYPVTIEFCSKQKAAARIIEILGGDGK